MLPVPAIVLAAGKSARMGRPKATLPLPHGAHDDIFLTRVLRTLADAGVADVLVILGHDPEPIVRAIAERGFAPRFVINPAYETGQLSSVIVGLRALDSAVEATLLTLVDVPLVSAATVRAVVQRFEETRAPIVRSVSNGRHGHPVLIARKLFQEIFEASADQGLKPIVRLHASAAGDVPVEDEGAFLDIDTPEAYARLI
jgi:molybdenum cofactor cytidylyltransferase